MLSYAFRPFDLIMKSYRCLVKTEHGRDLQFVVNLTCHPPDSCIAPLLEHGSVVGEGDGHKWTGRRVKEHWLVTGARLFADNGWVLVGG
jgi:hypothetical protein